MYINCDYMLICELVMIFILKVMFNLYNGSFMLKYYKVFCFKLVLENEGSFLDVSLFVYLLIFFCLLNCYC